MSRKPIVAAAIAIVMVACSTAVAQYGPGEEFEPIEFEPYVRDIYLRASGLFGRSEIEFDEYEDFIFFFTPPLEYDAEFNGTPGGSVAVGWASYEVELLFFEDDDVDDADNNVFDVAFAEAEVEAAALMFNFVVDIPRHSPVSAYLGGGIGVGYYDFEVFQSNAAGTEFIIDEDDDIGLGLQLLGGVRFEVDPHVDLYVGGRAFWLVGDDDIVIEYLALEAGLRFYF